MYLCTKTIHNIKDAHMIRKLLRRLCLGLCLLTTVLVEAQTSGTRARVLVETSKGKFVLELFDETPKHRDAFLANVRAGSYDGTLFHRVIKNFMIQGGNLKSKGLRYEDELPEDSISGTIEPEFLPERYIHTRGMLAAARLGDDENPKKLSSGSQFYIVTGKFYTEFDLNKEEEKHGRRYTPAQRQAYMSEGGAAHLDGAYTIFGRLLDSKDFKVIDKIQRAETDGDDRPIKNIVIKRMTILP